MKTFLILLHACFVWSFLSCSTAKMNSQKSDIVDIRWKLVELKGQAVDVQSSDGKEPFVIFAKENNRVSGMGGCNGFGGNYTLGENRTLKLTQLVSTKMACKAIKIETDFMQVLQSADNYRMAEGMLTLYEGDRGPMAKLRPTE